MKTHPPVNKHTNYPQQLTREIILDRDTTRLEYLLLRGADANAMVGGGVPIYFAVAKERHAAVEILLDRGCELPHAPPAGDGSARSFNHPLMTNPPPTTTIVQAFIDRGLLPPNSAIASALLCLAAGVHKPVLTKLLLEHGVGANARDEDGMTPLMRALAWADCSGQVVRRIPMLATVTTLIAHGADPDARWDDGHCVRDYRPQPHHQAAWDDVLAAMQEARPRGWWMGVLYALSLPI